MAGRRMTLRYTFENPNDADSFKRELKRILIDRLAAGHRRDR